MVRIAVDAAELHVAPVYPPKPLLGLTDCDKCRSTADGVRALQRTVLTINDEPVSVAVDNKGSRVRIPPSRQCDVSRHAGRPTQVCGFGRLFGSSGEAVLPSSGLVALGRAQRPDPGSLRLSFSLAGHFAPLVRTATARGRCRRSPRGCRSASTRLSYATAEVPLGPGDRLVMYTDGLIERRGNRSTAASCGWVSSSTSTATSRPQECSEQLAVQLSPATTTSPSSWWSSPAADRVFRLTVN